MLEFVLSWEALSLFLVFYLTWELKFRVLEAQRNDGKHSCTCDNAFLEDSILFDIVNAQGSLYRVRRLKGANSSIANKALAALKMLFLIFVMRGEKSLISKYVQSGIFGMCLFFN